RLKKVAEKNIKFVDSVSDKRLAEYYKNAKALIMPQEEDFGIVSVEAQMHGVPVIAFKKGGAKDTVIDGKTGILFDEQSVESLTRAIAKFEKIVFNHKYIIKNAQRFSKDIFKTKLLGQILKYRRI
ncbi:MAG: glycosyltransferase, partial [bacterium]|nr:glycosyltransferase [bacterium]